MTAPKLRFDGFDSDWALDSIGAVISNKSKKYDPEKSEIDFPCIELEHLSQQTGEILGTVSAKDQKSIKNVFDENSVLFGKLRPYLRKFAKPKFQGVCSSEIWVLTSKKMQPNFLFQYVQTDGFSELTQIQAGSKMPRADWGSISNGEILFPIFEEQTKIASFLSAVDEKISQLTQKLHLLSQYKQGMMQKLFSQQLRFKADDGSEFDEWNDIQLKDISHRITRKNKELNQNALTISAQLGLINQQEYFSKQIASRDLSKYYLLHKGEYAYNKSYSAGYPMGAIKRLKLYDKGVVSTLYICFSLNEYINSDYFEQFVESGLLVPELEKIAQEGARNHGLLNISLQEFFEVNLKMPSLDEQAKIANFLSAIDQKIEVTAQQIEQAKQWKKGLLQQMFV